MIAWNSRLTHFANPRASKEAHYPKMLEAILSIADAEKTYAEISAWPGYEATELHELRGISAQIGVARLWYKDEAQRFGLGSFKALGGAYAVFVQLQRAIEEQTGETASIQDLIDKRYAELLAHVVVSCATDGNHGRSVAWGAQLFGCQSVIYIHRDVSLGREKAIAAYGALVVRSRGNYDASVREAAADAKEFDRIVVSDTSYEGYMEIPKFVALGYTVMLKEVVEALNGEIPTHVFIQGGVGGLASAVCGYFWQCWGEKRPRTIIVEPEAANCLQESARAGTPVAVEGDLETLMAGLACGEVSLLAWQILSVGIDDFMTLDEGAVGPCMRLLASGEYGDAKIVAGESAVAGLAAVIAATASGDMTQTLGLDGQSRVLLIGTEGATDPELYQSMLTRDD